MGNTSTNSKRIERPYSIDIYNSLDRRESPRPDEPKTFEFQPGKRRPVLCYQNSSDYGNEDNNEDFKVSPKLELSIVVSMLIQRVYYTELCEHFSKSRYQRVERANVAHCFQMGWGWKRGLHHRYLLQLEAAQNGSKSGRFRHSC